MEVLYTLLRKCEGIRQTKAAGGVDNVKDTILKREYIELILEVLAHSGA